MPEMPATADDVPEWDTTPQVTFCQLREHIVLLCGNIDTICRNLSAPAGNTCKVCAMFMWLCQDMEEAARLARRLCHRLYYSLTYDYCYELHTLHAAYTHAMDEYGRTSINEGDHVTEHTGLPTEYRHELTEYQQQIREADRCIRQVLGNMLGIRKNRCNEWLNTLYNAHELRYMQHVLPDKWKAYKRKNLKQRFKYKDVKATDLMQVREELYNQLNSTELGRIWLEHNDEDDMAFMMARENLDSDDFDTFFKLLGLYNNMGEWIEEQRERESNGDPVFRMWVDVTALEHSLQFWVKGQMQKGKGKNQQHWMVFWCVMNELQMIRPEVRSKDYYERISRMFPDTEIPCQYESVRKLLTRDHHDKPIDRWEKTDPFQPLATELREKIKSIWDKIKNSNFLDLE